MNNPHSLSEAIRTACLEAALRAYEATARMNRGLSRTYQWHLLKSLKQGARRKARQFAPTAMDGESAGNAGAVFRPPAPLEEINRMKGFFEFDDRVTARLHGFEGAMHYYTSSSSRQYLHRHGGHVGFVGGMLPWRPRYWLDENIPNWLGLQLREKLQAEL